VDFVKVLGATELLILEIAGFQLVKWRKRGRTGAKRGEIRQIPG